MIVDGRSVLHGSVNFSRYGFDISEENAAIDRNFEVVDKFISDFKRLKQKVATWWQ